MHAIPDVEAGAWWAALRMLASFDGELWGVVLLSLRVSLTAVVFAALVGLPLGAALALVRFPGRGLAVATLNTLMGTPPVVAGLIVYLLLSRAGPLGELGLLFTPTAMIVVQFVLVLPIVAALARQTIVDLDEEYRETLRALGVGPWRSIPTLLWDGRFRLMTAVLAGFGRASAEVGAVIIVGGNINHVTRVMTTTIALETSKGNLALALGLGLVLIGIAFAINAAVVALNAAARRAEA